MKYSFYLYPLILVFNFASADNINSNSDLRTLFTTSQVRNELDLQRKKGKFNNTTQTTSTVIFKEPVTVKLQGVVLRDNKKPVIFINDTNTLKSSTVNKEITVNTNSVNKAGYRVPVRVNQQGVKIKPGQQWNETDRLIQDNYQIKPAKPETSVSDKISH